MSKWSISPVYKINSFITNSLRNEDILPAEDKYITQLSGSNDDVLLPFIIPSQQSPEIVTSYDVSDIDGFTDLPFITYSMTINPSNDEHYKICGQLAYILYTGDIDKLTEITQYIVDLCKREEYSAADLNDYLEQDIDNPFDFKTISIQNAVGPVESESLNGRHSFMIVINFDCVYDLISTPDNSLGPFSGKQNMWH